VSDRSTPPDRSHLLAPPGLPLAFLPLTALLALVLLAVDAPVPEGVSAEVAGGVVVEDGGGDGERHRDAEGHGAVHDAEDAEHDAEDAEHAD